MANTLPKSEFEQLVNLVPAVIWRANPNSFSFEYVSKEAEALLGYPVADWIGEPTFWVDHLHPEDRNWAVSFCKSAIEAGRPHEFEYRMIARDGRTVWIRDLVRTIGHAGEAPKVVGIMIDVTRRHESDRDKRSFEEQIRTTKRLEAFGEVTAGVAHDFNNTLTVISMHADMLRGDAVNSPRMTESLDAITMALAQGIRLTKSLIALSSDVPSEKKIIDLREPVEEARRMIRRVLPNKINLVFDNQTEQPIWINGDAAKIQQMLVSLALDARNGLSEGDALTVALHHSASPEDSATGGIHHGHARLTVSDSNDGDRPIRPARHADRSREAAEFALATAQNYSTAVEIVEDHDGVFHIDATDQGSIVQIDFPCVLQPERPPHPSEPSTQDLHHKRAIVIAEEDQQIREIAAAALQDAGFKVAPMSDRRGLEQYFDKRSGDVGLLLIDSNLSNGGAMGFIQSIRAKGHQTPCILMTEYSGIGEDSPEVCESESMQPVILLEKPFSMQSLVKSVNDLLARGGAET